MALVHEPLLQLHLKLQLLQPQSQAKTQRPQTPQQQQQHDTDGDEHSAEPAGSVGPKAPTQTVSVHANVSRVGVRCDSGVLLQCCAMKAVARALCPAPEVAMPEETVEAARELIEVCHVSAGFEGLSGSFGMQKYRLAFWEPSSVHLQQIFL